ncbi:MAG: Ig-like domain-containing protein [Bacteroidota bacterium]
MQNTLWFAFLLFAVGYTTACSNPTSTFPIVEDFETNALVNWTQDSGDDFNWSINTGATTSGSTGPSGAYSGSYYAYTEATTPNNPNKIANLISPCFTVQSGTTTQISFAYHMYGNGQGTFNLDISTNDGSSWTTLWSLSGNQGDVWRVQSLNLNPYIGQDVLLRFHVETNSYQSDVAIDDVVLTTSSTGEICDDGIDNDGDGLIDEYDPDCGVVCYNDCETPYTFDWFDGSGSGAVWNITNGQSSLTRVYTISGSQGEYNVSVTLDNPDGQNIDFTNCGTPGGTSHFYTGTCNDPNGNTNCDGDPNTNDSQFTYGCDFLTFGITSDNGDQKTSFTYDFEFPSQICNMLIGDIDHQGWAFNSQDSWQDEVEVVAMNNGVPVAINAVVGSKVNVFNNNTDSLVLISEYNGTLTGDLVHTDPDGHATITTLDKVTSIKFTYSNGPDDDGPSNDHAIRINGFEFCPEEKVEICNNEIDDDDDGLVDCEDIDCGMLDNIEFKDGTANWNLYNQSVNQSTFTIDNTGQISGNNSARIDITEIGSQEWFTIFEQNGASIESGKTYRIHFSAKANISREIQVLVQKTGFPFTTYFIQDVPIANFNGEYVYEFTATTSDNSVDLTFHLGQALGTVWLDKIQLKEVCPDPECILPSDDGFDICSGEVLSGTVSTNDAAPTNYFNTVYQVTTPPSNGNVVMQDDGSFVYTPDSGAAGTDNFVYERCYSFKNDVGLSNLIYNPCGEGKIIETFMEGIEGETNPSIAITNPTDFSRIFVEVWAESSCSSVTIEGQVATENIIYRSNGSPDTERIYRVELNSVSTDGLIDISSTGGCTLSSAAAYVERVQPSGQGSSSLVISDIDLFYNYVGGDDCFIYSMPIGTSDTNRDITFVIPLHEKDNTRNVTAKVIAGSVSEIDSTSSWSAIGEGAGVIEITLSNVPGSVNVATIEVCSPNGNGDSFGVGIISATSLICTAEPVYDCCSQATATVNISAASIANSNPTLCAGSGFATLTASDNSSSLNYSYAWGHTTETTSQVIVSPTATTTYTVTVTNDQGCMNTAETTVTVLPDLDVDIDYSGELCLEDNTQLSALVKGGSAPFSYAWAGPNSFTANTDVITIPESGNYSVTVTDTQGCTGQYSAFVYEAYAPLIFALNTEVCEGESVTLSINSGSAVQFNWGANAGNATSSSVTVTPSPPSTDYMVTVTNDLGCTSEATATINVTPRPEVYFTGANPICVGETTTLEPNTGGTWISTNSAVALINDLGQVTAVSPGTVNFIFTDTTTLCESLPTADLIVNPRPTVEVTGPTSICEGFTSQLSPTTGGVWMSNDPTIATVNNNGTVIGVSEGSTTFYFTNSISGCTSDDTQPITVNEVPTATITGASNLCIGSTTTLSPTTGGTWTSTNTSVATVSNGGIVQAIATGTASFAFTSSFGCVSQPTEEIVVNDTPIISVTGESVICEGETATLTVSGADAYVWSTDETTESIFVSPTTNTIYEVTGYNAIGTARNLVTEVNGFDNSNFTFINSTNSYAGAASLFDGVDNTSSATFHASRTNAGQTWGIGYSLQTDFFIDRVGLDRRNDCCTTRAHGGVVEIYNDGELVFTSNILTGSGNGELYCSPNPNVVGDEIRYVFLNGVNNEDGSGTLNFSEWIIEGRDYCEVQESFTVGVNTTPTVNISGSTTLCVGESTQLTTDASGGFWTSSDPSIAIVSSTGVVVGIGEGSVSFTYTGANGCESDGTGMITIDPEVEVEVDFNGSICLTEDSQLSAIVNSGTAGYTYAWIGPGGFASSQQTIDILINGNYNLTVTDSKGCSSNTTAFVYEAYEPFIFALNTEVCEGEEVTLSVNSSSAATYQWGVNAGNATTQSVTVTPGLPATTYFVTVTNSIGCTTEATAVINVEPKPTVSITGPDAICQNGTTQLSPSTGGVWTSDDYTVATVSNTGLVTGVGAGTTTFTFRSDATGCFSDPSEPITVTDNAAITITGDNQICIGDNPILIASVLGGSWSSSNLGVAQISSTGVITPNAQGSAIITYTPPEGDCYFDATYEINVHESPNLSINGPSTICENDVTYLSASTNGSWTSSDPGIATVSSTGVVTGVSDGTVTFSFVSSAGCPKTLGTPVTVIGNPVISLNGPADICINSTTSLLPNSGGLWMSSNTNVATVNSNGIVTGINPGIAAFTFIEFTYGCTSENTISITVNDDPVINGLDDNILCIGETTTITPSTGGTWSSSNNAVATIGNDGTITAIGPGSATFTFTDLLTGCTSEASMPLTVNSNPETNFNGPTSICAGETTAISPTTGGDWSSTNVAVATITSNGTITGVSPGTVQFIFTNSTTGCVSDASEVLTVDDPVDIQVTGPSNICIGESTTFTPTTGGTWESSNTNIATITNNGVVTGVAPGTVSFTFNSSTGCTSDPSAEITIEANPSIEFTGPTAICIGSTTTLTPTSGGEWSSSNNAVATVDNNGLVTALATGTANFTFVSSTTGCASTTNTNLNVYDKPTAVISGESQICIGEMTNMLPATGGTWVSSDNDVATIASNGVVTAISAGTVTFTFYETGSGCVSDASDPITVLPQPTVAITGDNILCEGETTTLSPTSGGVWISDNEMVATVTDQGVVTGHMQGLVRFTFTSNDGCSSNETSPVIVYGKSTVVLDSPNLLCSEDTGQMLPSSGGTWDSTDPSVATIDDNGVFTAVSAGTVRFTFTDSSTGCISELSDLVTVNETPAISIIGPTNICVGGVTNLVPTTGGIWTSLNPSIATIQNNGEVTGIADGSARFIFTNVATGCVSDTSSYVIVGSGPTITFTGPQDVCIGETSSISPSTGGTWISTNPSVASIDDNGLITAISQGSARFIYTETASGCTSDQSETLIVNGPPTVSVSGSNAICVNSTTTLSPSSGGTWISLHPAIAAVDDFGNVTGFAPGTAYFVFTDSATGCESDGSLSVEIEDGIDVGITGDTEICIGYSTTLSPSTGGFWTSSNPDVATVTNSGVVTGKAPGIVTFEFVDGTTGCIANAPTDPVTVELCTNHDFNVTLVGMEIQGNLSTNDNAPAGTVYSNAAVQLSKPLGSLPSLTVNSDGTYSFTSDQAGKYLYRVPVCIAPMIVGCPGTYLEITVIENIYSQLNPVANLEFATTYANADPLLDGLSMNIDVSSNDKCVTAGSCSLDNSTLSVTGGASRGSYSIMGTGDILYTPNPGFIGKDTIYYSICVDGEPTNCNNSLQVVTINDVSALNSTVAADDFEFTLKETPVSGNVMDNDSDPESNVITVVSQGSLMLPVSIPEGEYFIESDGSFTFTPAAGFSGPLEIVYTLCDNAAEQACTDATIHLLVFDDIAIKLRVYLEGALINNNGDFSIISGRPLMRDDLRISPFTGENYIPASDPYSFVHDPFVNTPAMFVKMGPGLISKNTAISDSAGVFSVSGDNAIVDWVHVELRSKDDPTVPIATRSGLLQRDGDVVDLDGVSDLRFDGVSADSFYVKVKHRSHLAAMSMKVASDQLIDFTDPNFEVFNHGSSYDATFNYTGLSQKENIVPGYTALWAGDFDSNGQVKFTNPNDDLNILFLDVLFSSPEFLINYNDAIGYFTGDYNMNSKAKYTNPDDDTNLLFGQLLLYPLNTSFLSNFNGLIEQVPE